MSELKRRGYCGRRLNGRMTTTAGRQGMARGYHRLMILANQITYALHRHGINLISKWLITENQIGGLSRGFFVHTFVPTAEDKYKGVADVSPHSRPPSRSPSAAALKAARHSLVVASKQCVITPPHPLPLSLAASTIIAESFLFSRSRENRQTYSGTSSHLQPHHATSQPAVACANTAKSLSFSTRIYPY